jgi:LmbE family N-acetylglucosaminyl deacetylase
VSTAARRILAVFAHPDDETSGCGGTFCRYAADGAQLYVVTATRGEKGTLGTGGLVVTREELPKVREQEQRAVAKLLGVWQVVYLGYVDGEVKDAPFQQVANRVLEVMLRIRPDVVITFGPTGISRHDDHIMVHRAATQAFHQYRERSRDGHEPALYYVAIPREMVAKFELDMDGVETQPTHAIDITQYKPRKVQALRLYRSQEDAQELASAFESMPEAGSEYFHQAYPPVPAGEPLKQGFW